MSAHVSATALEETPHETETTTIPISDELRRRALSVINDRRTEPQWRNIVRYALEINDPWLAASSFILTWLIASNALRTFVRTNHGCTALAKLAYCDCNRARQS